MAKIEPGTARWDEIWAKAELLRSEGKLNYVQIKKDAACGGDVAQRIIAAFDAAAATGGKASTGQPDDDMLAGKLPAKFQARWEASALLLHEIAVEVMQTMETEHAARQTSEVSRHHAEVRDLGVNLDAALEDVRMYSEAASDSEAKLETSEAQNVELRDTLTNAQTRCAQVVGDLESLRRSEATAQSERTAATVACARAETEAEHWLRRAEAAEGALETSRMALEGANNRVARLEGELEVGQRVHQEQRELLQSLTDSRHTRPTRADAKDPKSGK